MNSEHQQRAALRALDQFYTKPDVAESCWKYVRRIATRLAGKDAFFIEPSAGDGSFYDLLPKNRRFGMDLVPMHSEVIKRDWLKCRYKPPVPRESAVVIGNPPFGKRGKLAVDFVNKGLSIADTVCFIVPAIFRKYGIHKQLNEDARLIGSITLGSCSFRTIGHKDFSVYTDFQVWTRLPTRDKNMRLTSPPPSQHQDFRMFQYNNTTDALKVFGNIFNFAVPCQGYQDYSRRETRADDCEKHKQWILFHAKKRTILKLRGLDFEALAHKHITSTPGFRMNDVVAEYQRVQYG